jgi:uncharacterized membrane protein YdbT with pleckstrin-like domain
MKEQAPSEEPADYDQPVAYDVQGKPLYARPQASVQQVVHMSRPIEPQKQEVSPAAKARHNASRKLFPAINLSDGEYVITAVRRHPIGMIIPVAVGVLLMSLSLTALFNLDILAQVSVIKASLFDGSTLVLPLILLTVLFGIGTYVVYSVYTSNRFYLTNESVIQEIQTTLFSRNEQTVSLANIEDVSFDQKGIFQQLLNYGSIRLSTEGDETTYFFTYVAAPHRHVAILNDAVEAFKNGRPVSGSEY